MAKQVIDFKNGGDTGDRDNQDAIQRYDDGEPASETVFRRPVEHVRFRTEVLRTDQENANYLHDTNMRWAISGGSDLGVEAGSSMPTVTWSKGTGKFTISDDIILQPLNTPKTDLKETKDYNFGTSPTDATISFACTLFAYEGANKLRILWLAVAPGAPELGGAPCVAVVSGDPKQLLTIYVRNDWATTAQDVMNALTLVAGDLTTMGLAPSIIGTVTQTIDALPTDDDYTFNGTRERELHHITVAQIADFFTSHALVDGDTMSIAYNWMYEPSGGSNGGRKQSTVTTTDIGTGFPPNTHVVSGQMFITSDEPEKIPYAIPICKRIGDDLMFIDGTVVKGDATYSASYTALPFSLSGYLVDLMLTSWIPLWDLAASTYDGASVVDWPITVDTVQVNLESLQQYLNDKGALNQNEDVTGDWTFNGSPTFNAIEYHHNILKLQSLNAHTVGFAAAVNVVTPVYRSDGILTDGTVERETISVYAMEWDPPGGLFTGGAYLVLTGAYLEYNAVAPLGLRLHVAPGETPGLQTQVGLTVLGNNPACSVWDTVAGATLDVGTDDPDCTWGMAPATGPNTGSFLYKGASFKFNSTTLVEVDNDIQINSLQTFAEGYARFKGSQDDSGNWKKMYETPFSAAYPGIHVYYTDKAFVAGPPSEPGVVVRYAYNCVYDIALGSWTQVHSFSPSIMTEVTSFGATTFQKAKGQLSAWNDDPAIWDDHYDSIPRYQEDIIYPGGGILAENRAIVHPVARVFKITRTGGGGFSVVADSDTIDWRQRRIALRVVVGTTGIIDEDAAAAAELSGAYPQHQDIMSVGVTGQSYEFFPVSRTGADYVIDSAQYISIKVHTDGTLLAQATGGDLGAIIWALPTAYGMY